MKTLGLCMLALIGMIATCGAGDDFSLECTIKGDIIVCSLRNVTTDPITYSDDTIGYHGAVVVERYDEVADSWTPLRDASHVIRLLKGGGATAASVRTVVPGAIVRARRSEEKSPTRSFVVNLAEYDLPAGSALLRVTQVMGGTPFIDFEAKLPVWKGKVTSQPIKYEPNKAANATATGVPPLTEQE